MLQGVVSPFMETTPTIGFAMAASSSPMARMKARCGVRSSPSVVIRDRNGRTPSLDTRPSPANAFN